MLLNEYFRCPVKECEFNRIGTKPFCMSDLWYSESNVVSFLALTLPSNEPREKDRSFWFHLYGPDGTHHQKVEINEAMLTPNASGVDCCVSTSVGIFICPKPSLICLENYPLQG